MRWRGKKGRPDRHQGMTAKSKNHIDGGDFYISAGGERSLVSSSMTFTAVKTIGKHTDNSEEVFSLTKKTPKDKQF